MFPVPKTQSKRFKFHEPSPCERVEDGPLYLPPKKFKHRILPSKYLSFTADSLFQSGDRPAISLVQPPLNLIPPLNSLIIGTFINFGPPFLPLQAFPGTFFRLTSFCSLRKYAEVPPPSAPPLAPQNIVMSIRS